MKKILVATMVLVASFTISQTSNAREFAKIYQDCGIGGIIGNAIDPNQPVWAIITNVTWDLGTTAVLSDALSPDTCSSGNAMAATFIHDSYAPIEQDLASGQGEYLDSLVATAGCSEDSRADLSAAVRQEFAERVAISDYADQTRFQKAEGLYNILVKNVNGQFAGDCSLDS